MSIIFPKDFQGIMSHEALKERKRSSFRIYPDSTIGSSLDAKIAILQSIFRDVDVMTSLPHSGSASGILVNEIRERNDGGFHSTETEVSLIAEVQSAPVQYDDTYSDCDCCTRIFQPETLAIPFIVWIFVELARFMPSMDFVGYPDFTG